MAVGPRLRQGQSQSLALSQGMRHALRTLALSASDLTEELGKAAADNPFLQIKPTATDAASQSGSAPSDMERIWPNSTKTRSDTRRYRPWHSEGGAGQAGDLENLRGRAESLGGHVMRQISFLKLNDGEARIALALLDALEPTGYLATSPEAIAKDLDLPKGEVAAVLARLQQLDPPGVFAISLSDCLARQLSEQGRMNPLLECVLQNLPLLAEGRMDEVARRAGTAPAEIAKALTLIRGLDPKPGLALGGDAPAPLVDLFAEPGPRGAWRVTLNPEIYPHVEVADLGDLAMEAKQTEALKRAAQDWRQAMSARGKSLLALGEQLLAIQGDFIRKGEMHLRPLSQKALADLLALHPATVSRLLRDKTMSTPKGVMLLRDFLSPEIQTQGKARVSAAQVKRMLADYYLAAPQRASDQRLANLLKERGILIARRTVTKYRLDLSGRR